MGRGKFGLQAMQVTDYPNHFDTEVKAQGEAERLSAEYDSLVYVIASTFGGYWVDGCMTSTRMKR
jgi:hypothetical protein